MPAATVVHLSHPEGGATVEALADGRRRVTVRVAAGAWVPHPSCETGYPLPLLERLLAVKGPAWLCDEVLRDEDPARVEQSVRKTLLSHVPAARLAGARVLDFGCGSGASTAVLARLLPDAEVVGVELDARLVEIARLRVAHQGAGAPTVLHSPAPDRMPDGLGSFDVIYLSAVWEHLLPAERATLPAQLWRLLRPGGVLLLTETPYRWSPVETHSTGFPLVNHLPRPLAARVARRSPRVGDDETWAELLRNGLRGGSVPEVLRTLRAVGDGTPVLLPPLPELAASEEALWLAHGPRTHRRRAVARALTALRRTTGIRALPWLNLAIEKRADSVSSRAAECSRSMPTISTVGHVHESGAAPRLSPGRRR